ncbi:IS3 family transposase [Snodgrassella communis]|uniref:IS3 family transposase n=1 Tax=Snodgrassella communis TaxID=2946699 RepID=UPI0015D52665|nr:IS3 family transposase [Snodgrassella communis]
MIAHYADKILTIFKRSYQSYGTRRIRFALQQAGISVSRRYIARVMKSLSLVSKYTIKRYREYQTASNSIVADLTYIRVNHCWNYLCVLLNLSNRQIAGYRVGKRKTADLVMCALSQIKQPLSSLHLFHSDRGKEFDKQLLGKQVY